VRCPCAEVAVPSVVHVIVTGKFAGAERYVCDVAAETAARGWETTVVGGDPQHMPEAISARVRWLPGATPLKALRSLARLGRQDVCHAHMTLAEGVAVSARPLHRAPVISTRHFAARRGSSRAGRLLAPWIAGRLARELAVSEFVAQHLERPPDAVIKNGVPPTPCLWRSGSRVVLMLQRLEPEKDTLTGLRAWQGSRLSEDGWSLRVVGAGSERAMLEEWARSEQVPALTFAGWTDRVVEELAGAGMLLASATAEPFGLGVIEAMAAGIPVVASAAGGHLETVGKLDGAPMFPPGEADSAAAAMRSLEPAGVRAAASQSVRDLVAAEFTISRHVDELLVEYEAARRPAGGGRTSG
jgi:glycosyltransferase involved in cell wall biosynthesis